MLRRLVGSEMCIRDGPRRVRVGAEDDRVPDREHGLGPDRLALVDGVEDRSARQEWTYAKFLQDAERAARALLKRFHTVTALNGHIHQLITRTAGQFVMAHAPAATSGSDRSSCDGEVRVATTGTVNSG